MTSFQTPPPTTVPDLDLNPIVHFAAPSGGQCFSARRVLTHLLLATLILLLTACSRSAKSHVVLYTSQDQFYAEPILKDFTARTGIEVRPVFDTESAKTAGLAHRLRAEAGNPQCDVFWSNEEMHTRLLVQAGVVREKDWRTVGSRTRRLVINTNLISSQTAPKSLLELTNSVWNGRVALAYPLFGTTKSHFLALRQLWGEDLWKSWCYGLIRNGAKIVDGNSVVVKLVGAGECAVGLTDSDDIAAGIHDGKPIAALPTSGESIAIASTVALVRDAPHPSAAQALIDYLSKVETIQRLVSIGALERTNAKAENVQLFSVDWPKAFEQYDLATAFLELIFVRS
jgi:iron(III) transport system substrate-binding protein